MIKVEFKLMINDVIYERTLDFKNYEDALFHLDAYKEEHWLLSWKFA